MGLAVSAYDELKLRIDRSADGYRVLASSPEGEAQTEFVLPFNELQVENFILRMSRGRRGARRVEASEIVRAKDFGKALFDALVRDDVRELYHRSLARSDAEEDRGLRLSLALSGVPELMDVPWEFLYDDPNFLAVSVWTPVVRYLDLPTPKRPLRVDTPLRVLALISSPHDYDPLDVDHERETIECALAPLRERGLVELRWLEEANLRELRRVLMHGDDVHVFHYVGHADFDEQTKTGVVLLEDADGRGKPVPAWKLGQTLHDTRRSLRLVVLNACEGALTSPDDPFAGVAPGIVQQGIPAVIAMQFEITDAAAIVFSQGFYEALAGGYPVDAALAEARMAILADDNDVEWATPVLFMRVPDGRIFDVPDGNGPPPPRLELTLRPEPAVCTRGQTVSWVLTARNAGAAPLSELTAHDGLGARVAGPVDLNAHQEREIRWSDVAERELEQTVTVGGRTGDGSLVSAQASASLSVTEKPPWWREHSRLLAGGAIVALVAVVAYLLLRDDGPGTETLALGGGTDGVTVGEGSVWVADRGDSFITRVDPQSMEETGSVDVQPIPDSLAVHHNRGELWVTIMRENRVDRIDPTTEEVVERIPVGEDPEGVVAGFGAVWVANKGSGTVTRIGDDGERVSRPVGPEPIHLAVAEDKIWVTVSGQGRLVELDAETADRTGRSIPVEGAPRGVAFHEGLLWVAASQADKVVVADPSEQAVVDSIDVEPNPREVRAGEGGLWVTNADGGVVSKIDASSRTVEGTVGVEGRPHGLAVGGGYVWATSADAGVLTRIDPDSL
jgi:DNA-binding beta-propeller fold protein YncE